MKSNIQKQATLLLGVASFTLLFAVPQIGFSAQKTKTLAPAPNSASRLEPIERYTKQLVLKSEAIVNDPIVRLSDLIEGLDPANDIPMFRAPDLGQIGTIQASRILLAATENRINNVDTRDLTAVVVRRAGHLVSREQMLEQVTDALRTRYGLPQDTDLVVDSAIKPLMVEAEARRTPQMTSFYYDNRKNRFEASFTVPGSEITNKSAYKISGTLGEFVRVPVVIRNLNKGDTISANDIAIEKRKRVEIYGEAPVDLTKVTGQIAKRGLRIGDIIGTPDLSKAEWVERGSNVTLIYESSGLSLSTKGKAVTGGGDGESISVINLQSKRQVDGIIIGPGKVSVRPKNIPQTLANSATQSRADISGLTPTRSSIAGVALQ